MDNKLSCEQQISKARVEIMSDPDWRWLASVMMMGKTEYVGNEHQVKTAATDGLNEIYNREYTSKLNFFETKAMVLHENLHKVFRHLVVWRELHEQGVLVDCGGGNFVNLAGIACDVVINTQYLHGKPKLQLGKNWVHMPEYADTTIWNAKSIFEDLKKKGTDTGNKPQQGHDHHDWEGAKKLSQEQQQAIEKQIDRALRQAAMTGGLPRGVQEMLAPPVDWRTLLSEFVKTTCTGQDQQTWRKPHRTYLAHNLYLPTPYSESVGNILIAVDTSGSIGDEALGQFLGHCQQLVDEVNPSGLDICWWGSEVVGVDEFKRGDTRSLVSAVNPKGGGGTDPACIPAWIAKRTSEGYAPYECCVVITDGEFGSDIGDWNGLPVLWLVVGKSEVGHIGTGKVIQVGEL